MSFRASGSFSGLGENHRFGPGRLKESREAVFRTATGRPKGEWQWRVVICEVFELSRP